MLMQIQNNPALKDGLEQLLKMSKIRATLRIFPRFFSHFFRISPAFFPTFWEFF
jgi:hypothetical protein